MKNEIIIYSSQEVSEKIEVRIDDDTVWLAQKMIAELFQTTTQNVTIHLKNIYQEGELSENTTCKEFLHVQKEGGRTINRKQKFYNLDAIISIGYRIKSRTATQFRIWATQVLKDYLLRGYALNNRMNRIEDTVVQLSEKVYEIEFQIQSTQLPTQGVFFEGQIYDAYELFSKLIRSAKNNIILIDNYLDERTITQLAKKNPNVQVYLFCKKISHQLQLDIEKANEQYGGFEVKEFDKSHDRFLIIDKKDLYHIGASLKDLGKKWFAFTKLDATTSELIIKHLRK